MLTVEAIVNSQSFKNLAPIAQEYTLSMIRDAMGQQGKTLEQLLLIDNLESQRLRDIEEQLEEAAEDCRDAVYGAKMGYNEETKDAITDILNDFVDAVDCGLTHEDLEVRAAETKKLILRVLE